MDTQKINSWEDLQKNVKKIAVLLNKDENLKLAAASNPFFALEELGFEINPEIKDVIEDKLRFKPNEVEKLSQLRLSIFKYAGRVFDIRSQSELNEILFDELQLSAFDEKGCPLFHNIIVKNKNNKDQKDELYEYGGLHPIISPLTKFREIDSSIYGFCNKETYLKIREGKHPISSRVQLNIRLKAPKS